MLPRQNLSELNINEGGLPTSRTHPSAGTIAEFESKFGIDLPDGLKCLLNTINGGHPEFDCVGGADGQYAVNRFYHLTPEDHGSESLWYAATHWRPILGDKALVFAGNGGGDSIFFRFSRHASINQAWLYAVPCGI
ncbi:SMI1/KNR4 family protein [Pseudoduganella namucuonensis]|uniref:SMI1/KNR4 family protein n=1 Tax=Pseudoduganella namucuonensis TaxID=1035707 RepID=UPI000B885399